MKQNSSDKYTIAWFKLAECIARGEKERALGVYRLLSHSFDDRAVARQLEGDIFLSFKDTSIAVERYREALEEYRKDMRYLEAAAVGEHLVTIEPDNEHFRAILIELYRQLSLQHKVKAHSLELIHIHSKQREWHRVVEVLQQMQSLLTSDDQALAYAHLVVHMHEAQVPMVSLESYIQTALDFARAGKNSTAQLMTLFQISHEELHAKARMFLEK